MYLTKMYFIVGLSVCTFSWLTVSASTIAANESVLVKNMLNNYEKRGRPISDTGDQVTVTLSMNMLKLHEINNRLQFISVIGWVTASWTDLRLSWNMSEYGEVDSVVLFPTDIWIPGFVLGNSASGALYDSAWSTLYKVVAHSNGTVKWFPGGEFVADCQIDVRYFPFDEQICKFVFQNWVYTSNKVNLTFDFDAEDTLLDFYDGQNGMWDVIAVKVIRRDHYYESPEPYPEVHIGLHCKRKPLFYIINIILLSVLLAVLVLMMFKLPPESGERISMGVTLLLAFSVFILMIDSSIPETSLGVPIIIIYLIMFMTLTTLGISESVLVLYCYHHSRKQRAPKWIRFVILKIISRCLCDRNLHKIDCDSDKDATQTFSGSINAGKDTTEFDNNNGRQDNLKNHIANGKSVKSPVCGEGKSNETEVSNVLKHSNVNVQSNEDILREWKGLATIIDKFSFWFFLGMFLFLMLILLIILPLSQPRKDINNTIQWAGF